MTNIPHYFHVLIWLPTYAVGIWGYIVGNKYVTLYRKKNNLIKKNDMYEANLLFFVYNPRYIFYNPMTKKQKDPELEKLRIRVKRISRLATLMFIVTAVLIAFT